ncbi:MAG: UMP kinase [Pseudomonadota bacterium]
MADIANAQSGLTYERILLKLSGEALMGPNEFGIDMPTVLKFAKEIAGAREAGAEICLVIGGGNIFRGLAGAAQGMDRSQADSMGMLATVMNALAMQSALEQINVPTRVQSAIPMDTVCEPFIRRRAVRHMEKGRVVIFAAGTGNPFFTTDTGAALRAAEMGCDALLKGTQVDGVYTADPKIDPTATRFETLPYQQVLAENLRVMDPSAVSLMRDSDIPIVVFSLHEEGTLLDVLHGQGKFTVIKN